MSYKQIKWMILFVPTLTVGLWEYVRHTLLMPYLSMEAGNFLTPVFVFLISMTLLSQLFNRLEQVQEELNKERAENAALAARDLLARELHDGIAQSLFLLSVKMDRAELRQKGGEERSDFEEMRKLVHEVNRYVRQAIANLRFPTQMDEREYKDSMESRIDHTAKEAFIHPAIQWSIPDSSFTAKEKVELLACIREALLNIQKHAHADRVLVTGSGDEHSWIVRIDDNGRGTSLDPFHVKDRYGLRIMKERALELQWQVDFISLQQGSRVEIRKGEELT
ncbi:histidine kinase [Paenibacillus sp.]|jgi:two-component system nitrate/nitrite sensor histidine kinase NarQ|uniref:sensor histidine kinase n=1 Tax=Paenibacillus sp. TaxID=58172 RepID=UPI0028203059|nr:histidine kinase [Paenibacillus sp.]MDR0269575.1 histidine kinase [Paenibacillus sp.]